MYPGYSEILELPLGLVRLENQIHLPLNDAHGVTSPQDLRFFASNRCFQISTFSLRNTHLGSSSVLICPGIPLLIPYALVLQMSLELGNDAESCQHAKPYQCPECGRVFTLLPDAQKHLEAVHSIYQNIYDKAQGHDPDTEGSFDDWSKPELLHSIHESIDWLHRLSNMVRKASFNHQNKRADGFMLRDKHGQKSEELTRSLFEGLTQLYQFYIKTHATGLGEQLAERLVQTMIIRHRRTLYRKSRRQVWNLEQINYTPHRAEQKPHEHHSSAPLPIPETTASSRGNTLDLPQPTPKTEMAPSQVTATTVDVNLFRKVFAQSEVSKTTSNSLFLSDRVLVPPRPAAARLRIDFICEYCGLLLQARQASSSAAWA